MAFREGINHEGVRYRAGRRWESCLADGVGIVRAGYLAAGGFDNFTELVFSPST